jgi:8-oxo-dGTP diphosphatase
METDGTSPVGPGDAGPDPNSTGTTTPDPVVRCAGGIVRDDLGRILLVRRANEPGRGLWSLPGGRCEPGESAREACIREVREECGLEIAVERLAGTAVRPGAAEGTQYEIADFFCSVVRGTATAGDDADAVRWADAAALGRLSLTDGLLEALVSWGAVAARPDAP